MLVAMTYIALLPEFNFEVWVPVQWLNSVGASDEIIDLVVRKSDKIAHFFGALILFILYRSHSVIRNSTTITFSLFILSLLIVGAEIAQLQVGRNFSLEDIAAGMLGGLCAAILTNSFEHRRRKTPTEKKHYYQSN